MDSGFRSAPPQDNRSFCTQSWGRGCTQPTEENDCKAQLVLLAANASPLGSSGTNPTSPMLPQPAGDYNATIHAAFLPAEAMLEQPIRIPSSEKNCNYRAYVNEQRESTSCWEPHQTQRMTAIASAADPSGMAGNDVEPLELCYQKMLGVDSQARSYHLDDGDLSDDEGVLMMKPLQIIPKNKIPSHGITDTHPENAQAQKQADQEQSKFIPQQIPHILVQTVTPPDSKVLHKQHLTQDAVTTARPSPAPASIAPLQPSPVVMIPTRQVQRNIGLATPEYTLVDHQLPHLPSNVPSSSRFQAARALERVLSSKPQSSGNWRRVTSVSSASAEFRTRALQRDSKGFNSGLGRTHSLQEADISESLLKELIPSPLWLHDDSQHNEDLSETESYSVIPTVVLQGHECPPDNYDQNDFTKEALRKRWEVSQSYLQWPVMRNRQEPLLAVTELDERDSMLLRRWA
ncbi:hypothetical protein BDZ91DRAFT_798341 [Kalaharituber pfeilii]|nr:hypothetical protein BDZ91DRAFT_798341 [Kalaharituber pfeilii]